MELMDNQPKNLNLLDNSMIKTDLQYMFDKHAHNFTLKKFHIQIDTKCYNVFIAHTNTCISCFECL